MKGCLKKAYSKYLCTSTNFTDLSSLKDFIYLHLKNKIPCKNYLNHYLFTDIVDKIIVLQPSKDVPSFQQNDIKRLVERDYRIEGNVAHDNK